MKTTIELTTRERWIEVLSLHSCVEEPEYRRECSRRPLMFDGVKLAFEESCRPVVRGGKLLNASPSGVMIRQYKEIQAHTLVMLSVALDEETLVLAGEVVHSTQTVGGYKVGIELRFTDPSK